MLCDDIKRIGKERERERKEDMEGLMMIERETERDVMENWHGRVKGKKRGIERNEPARDLASILLT